MIQALTTLLDRLHQSDFSRLDASTRMMLEAVLWLPISVMLRAPQHPLFSSAYLQKLCCVAVGVVGPTVRRKVYSCNPWLRNRDAEKLIVCGLSGVLSRLLSEFSCAFLELAKLLVLIPFACTATEEYLLRAYYYMVGHLETDFSSRSRSVPDPNTPSSLTPDVMLLHGWIQCAEYYPRLTDFSMAAIMHASKFMDISVSKFMQGHVMRLCFRIVRKWYLTGETDSPHTSLPSVVDNVCFVLQCGNLAANAASHTAFLPFLSRVNTIILAEAMLRRITEVDPSRCVSIRLLFVARFIEVASLVFGAASASSTVRCFDKLFLSLAGTLNKLVNIISQLQCEAEVSGDYSDFISSSICGSIKRFCTVVSDFNSADIGTPLHQLYSIICFSTLQLQNLYGSSVILLPASLGLPESGTVADWQTYTLQFNGRMLPGCSNMLCQNLTGFHELHLNSKLCSGCRRVRYCCNKCQKEAWILGKHNAVCALWKTIV